MPRFDKWLSRIAQDAPADRVARRAIAARLQAVAWYLAAAIGSKKEQEATHHLRTWTRRTEATLRLFAPALPHKPVRKLKKTLRKIRRAAGEVRDCDVHLEQLRADAGEPPKHLARELAQQRRTARRRLKSLRRKLRTGARLERQGDKVLQDIAWPKRHSRRAAPPFAPWCRLQLAVQAADFFERGEPADDAALHELRKAGKRLRYTLELAAGAVAKRLHQGLYEDLSGLQDRLGDVCDHLAAVRQIHAWQAAAPKPKHHRQLAELLAREVDRLAVARSQFRRWWTPARRQRWQHKWQSLARNPEVPAKG